MDELIKDLRESAPKALAEADFDFVEGWLKEAADAIEELQKRVPPVPHGRLIDADAFEQHIKKDWEEYDHWIAVEVENRPTILEAEEDE